MKQLMDLLIGFLVVVGLMLPGCVQSRQENQIYEPVSVSGTIAADCIVQYYKTNNSAYITQQKHWYNPSAGFLKVISEEPGGDIQFTLLDGKYTSSDQKKHQLSDLPNSFGSKNLAVGLFYSFCAGSGLLKTDGMTSSDNIKIEGQWYKAWKLVQPSGIDLTLLQSLDTKRIELVQLEDDRTGLLWLLRSYNFIYKKDLSDLCPEAIDVFDIRNGIASKELMIRFDYKNIQKVEQ